MLNLVLVKSLLAVLRAGSFQAAADALGIAQPTVSLHVRRLEEQLGVPLVRRARNGCEPTPAAEVFLPYAESLLRLNDRALSAVHGAPLRIGASSNIGIYLLPPYLRSYLRTGAKAAIDLAIDANTAIAVKLDNGELDVAVMEWWDGRAGYQAQVWRREPVVLIVHPEHPLAARSQVERYDLWDLPLLGGEAGTGTGRLLAAYFGGETRPRVAMQLGSTEAVKQAVKVGLGVSVVLASAVADDVRSGSLCAIPLVNPVLCKDLFLITRRAEQRRATPPPFVRHLLESSDSSAA